MQHMHDPVPRLPENLKAYQPIIDKMMVKDRKRRLRSRNSLNDLIKELLNQNTEKININRKDPKSAAVGKANLKVNEKTIANSAKTVSQLNRQMSQASIDGVKSEGEESQTKKLVWVAASLIAGGILLLNWNFIAPFFVSLGEMFKSILDFLF